jgi:hypothetical protein
VVLRQQKALRSGRAAIRFLCGRAYQRAMSAMHIADMVNAPTHPASEGKADAIYRLGWRYGRLVVWCSRRWWDYLLLMSCIGIRRIRINVIVAYRWWWDDFLIL